MFEIFLRIDGLNAQLSFEGPADIESEIFLRIDWVMARLSFEGPPGKGLMIFLGIVCLRPD